MLGAFCSAGRKSPGKNTFVKTIRNIIGKQQPRIFKHRGSSAPCKAESWIESIGMYTTDCGTKQLNKGYGRQSEVHEGRSLLLRQRRSRQELPSDRVQRGARTAHRHAAKPLEDQAGGNGVESRCNTEPSAYIRCTKGGKCIRKGSEACVKIGSYRMPTR